MIFLADQALEISIPNARAYINQMNLDYIVNIMCSSAYPLPRWTLSDAMHCCYLYKNFLLLQKIHKDEHLVPTREIDEFWHNHILYTKQYTADCIQIFGHYLHHHPASPDDNPEDLLDHYQKTKEYYLAEFKEPLCIIGSQVLSINN